MAAAAVLILGGLAAIVFFLVTLPDRDSSFRAGYLAGWVVVLIVGVTWGLWARSSRTRSK